MKEKRKRRIPKAVLGRYSLKAIWRLAKMAHLDFDTVIKALNLLSNRQYQRKNKIPYKVFTKPKASGGRRYIYAPVASLKEVQQGINRFILSRISPHPKAFGFSGSPNVGEGTVEGALTPHLASKTIMTLDIMDAFPNTDSDKIRRAVNDLQVIQLPGTEGRIVDEDMAKIIIDIVTFPVWVKNSDSSALPQGAPTSPRLFDLAFRSIDEKLDHLAKNVGGIYTRYADNIFFSMPAEEFPEKIQRAITRIIKKKGYSSHKIQTRKIGDAAIRALGLNIIDGELHNTRRFKQNLRLTFHHLEWLKTNERKTLPAMRVLNGQKSWAKTKTLPEKLRRKLTKKHFLQGKQLKLSV